MQRKQEEVEGGFPGRLDGGDGFCRKRAQRCWLFGRGAVRVWVLNLQCIACPATPLSSGNLCDGSDGALVQLQSISTSTLGDVVFLCAGQHPSQACDQCWGSPFLSPPTSGGQPGANRL